MKIEKFKIYSNILKEYRTIRVLLPEGYDTNLVYPVIYMQDGNNLFLSDNDCYNGTWMIDEILKDNQFNLNKNKYIICGVDNTTNRNNDYLPFRSIDFSKYVEEKIVPFGGNGDKYADFFVLELKKFIDKNYKTKSDYFNTSIVGSSFGAVISLYISLKYKEVFKNVGLMSIASWANHKSLINYLNENLVDLDERFFISCGTKETSLNSFKKFNEVYLNCSIDIANVIQKKGLDSVFYIFKGEEHNELAWSKSFIKFLEFIK